jgi:outer membrane lipoprotein-sorting protein
MTTGTRILAETAAAVLAASVLSSAASEPGLDAPQLMQMLASVRSATASFVETRYSALLKTPLISRGTLSYRRPDRLEKHVESPREERIVLQDDRLTIDAPSESRSVSGVAGGASGIGALIEAVRAARAGDLAALEHDFELEVAGTRDDWRLRLTPRTPGFAQYVSAVTVSGAGPRMQRIEVLETSGDRTVMQIEEALD